MPGRDRGVDVVPVERAVGGGGVDGAVDPVEQGADLRATVGVLVGERRGDDPAGVGVRGEVELFPGSAPRGAVFLLQPLAGPAQPQSRAVHQQVHGFAPGRGRATSSVSARRLSVEWSGTARSRPSRWRMEPISPSVWRSAWRNTARRVRAVVIANAE